MEKHPFIRISSNINGMIQKLHLNSPLLVNAVGKPAFILAKEGSFFYL